jgi:hypothetical protein
MKLPPKMFLVSTSEDLRKNREAAEATVGILLSLMSLSLKNSHLDSNKKMKATPWRWQVILTLPRDTKQGSIRFQDQGAKRDTIPLDQDRISTRWINE